MFRQVTEAVYISELRPAMNAKEEWGNKNIPRKRRNNIEDSMTSKQWSHYIDELYIKTAELITDISTSLENANIEVSENVRRKIFFYIFITCKSEPKPWQENDYKRKN